MIAHFLAYPFSATEFCAQNIGLIELINPYTVTIKSNDDSSEAFFNRGIAYDTLKDYEAALTDLQRPPN